MRDKSGPALPRRGGRNTPRYTISESQASHAVADMTPLPYGPHTAAVRRFLQRVAALDAAAWGRVAADFERIERTAPYASADRALESAVQRADRTAARDAVVGPIVALTRPADGNEPHPVAAAVLAAALALVVRDVLDPGAFGTLYGAFAGVIPVGALDDAR